MNRAVGVCALLLPLLLLLASPHRAEAFLPDLQLSVIAATPDAGAVLQGKDAITVTFSRAVIALGADWAPGALPAELTPFALTGAGASVPGRLRWVTTFSARFDPVDDWPTDLAFDVEINAGLASFDGAALAADENTSPRSFTTPGVRVSMGGVASPQATALTDGHWVSAISTAGNQYSSSAEEMPPDGVLTLRFSHAVDPATVGRGLQLRDGSTGISASGASLAVAACTSRWASDTCVAVTVVGSLAVDTTYQVVFPAGSTYHPLCGPTSSDSSFTISGLVSFQIPFRTDFSSYNAPNSQRWDIWARHGLAPGTTAAMVQAAISISPTTTFTVSIKDLSTLRLEGEFEPSTEYHITVVDSAACLDGFNLPLTGSAAVIVTGDRPEFFLTPGANQISHALFNTAAPDQWTVLSQGTTRCLASNQDLRSGDCSGHDPMYVDAFSVAATHDGVTGAIATLLNNQETFSAAGVATAGPVQSPMTDTVTELGFPTAPLLASTGLFVVNRWNNMMYDGSAAQKDSDLVGTTDIGVTFAASAEQQLVAWATRLDTNADVPFVSISIYNVESTYQCTPDSVSLITTVTTGNDGLAAIDLSSMTDRYPTLFAVVNSKGKLSIIRNLPRFRVYNNGGNADARIITDRGLYKVGDTISVKGFVRDHSGSQLDIPSGMFTLQTHFKSSAAAEETPVLVDAAMGTFSVQLTVPADADYRDTQISLQWQPAVSNTQPNNYARQVGSAQITIADPRPPTVKLSLGTDGGDTVMAVDGQITLSVVTTTYTGSAVGGALVDVTWSLSQSYGSGSGTTGIVGLLGSQQGVSQGGDTFPTSGSLTLTSGDDGHGTHIFAIDGLADQAAQFPDGSTVQISATWTGPTREVVTDSLTVTISSSPWEVSVDLTPSNPVPGYTFATTVDLREVATTSSILSHDVSVHLYEWPEGSVATVGNNGAPVIPGRALLSCTMQSDAGVNPGCPMSLPDMGQYALVVCAQGNTGSQVCSARLLGKTADEWAASPLSNFESAFSMVPNQQTYAVGDTAQFSFFNPFSSGCRAFVHWGNKLAKQQLTTAVLAAGPVSVDVPLSQECRGGCRVMIILTAPTQLATLSLPVQLPTSPLFDISEATVITSQHTLSVPSHEHELSVSVQLDNHIVEPGATAGFTVTLTDANGRPVAGEVGVFAVDQAFLDLKPHPAVDLASAFALNMLDGSRFASHSSLESLASAAGVDNMKTRMQTLVEMDPWSSLWQWPLVAGNNGIEGDLQHYASARSSFITEQGCTYCSASSAGGGMVTNGGGMMGGGGSGGSYSGDGMDAGFAPPRAPSGAMPPMPAPPPPSSMAMGAGANSLAPSRGTSGSAAAATAPSADIPVRTAFETTPLYLPTLSVPASGSVHVPFPLPDNVGTFNVRAYSVTSHSQFGVGEAQQVVRNALSLVASTPRIVRVGDDFSCGFTLTTADASFSGPVQVTATVNSGGLSLSEAGSQTVYMSSGGPQEVIFSFAASALEDAELQFSASATVGADAFSVALPVKGAQDGVCIATSMAVDGSADGTPWPEGLVLPDAVAGSGSLVLSAGAGYLPTVQALSQSLLNLPPHLDGSSLINALAPAAMLRPYPSSKTDTLPQLAAVQVAASFAELQKFTDVDGLRYSLHKSSSFGGASYINTNLNANAMYYAQRLSDNVVAGVDARVVGQWRTALVLGLVREAQMAGTRGYSQYGNDDTLANARLVLGTGDDWISGSGLTLSDAASTWLSMDSLVARVDSCSDFCKAATAMTLLSADARSAQAAAILQTMIARMRVQGRTGYITSGHQGHATSMLANSMFLSAATTAMSAQRLSGFSTLTMQKLANYVAQGSPNQRWAGEYASRGDAHRGFALADYDTFTGSNSPNVQLSVTSGTQQLLSAAFTPAHEASASTSTPWENLGSPPAPLTFAATGSGELSIAASMTFIPSQIYASSVYRGLYVEKVIQAIDPATGQPTGAPLQAAMLGQMVAVTIQLTTPDDVQDLVLEDWTAGGLEPVDPNVDDSALNTGSGCSRPRAVSYGGGFGGMGGGGFGGGPPPMPSFDGGSYYSFFSCTSFERQTRTDRVSYYSQFVRAGTHSATYQAMAATSGQFVLPPAKASLAAQPEVMGLSAGGSFAVSRSPLTVAQRFLPVSGAQPLDCPATCENDCSVTTGACNPPASLTTAAGGGGGGGAPIGGGHRRQLFIL